MKLHVPRFVGFMFCNRGTCEFRYTPIHITKVAKNSFSWSNGFGEGKRSFASYADCEADVMRAITQSFHTLYEKIQKGELKS